MSRRFFTNPYPDYQPGQDSILTEEFKDFIKTLIKKNVDLIFKNTNPAKTSQKRPDLYVGSSGIAYMFLKLHQSCISEDFLTQAQLYNDNANHLLQSSGSRKPISLLSGDAGVHAVSAVIHKSSSKHHEESLKNFLRGIQAFDNPDYLDDGADEMLVGRCGYLLAIHWLKNQLNEEILDKSSLDHLSQVIVNSGRSYASRYSIKLPLMYQYHGRKYLGAAHGISAILLALLMTPLNPTDLNDVKATIDGILQLQDEHGNFPSKYGKSEYHLVHWCHGAPGVVYLMAKAYKVFGDQKYLDSCVKCSDLVWERGLLLKGPGICHGIAGNGYVHLLLFRLTGEEKFLYRAKKFAEFLENEEFLTDARTPDRPFSLFEGLAGTVCFLVDLLEPEKAEFPFMNVFD